MNERDELASHMAGHHIEAGYGHVTTVGWNEAREMADAILAAGWVRGAGDE